MTVKVKPLEWQMLPPPFATGPLRPTARIPLGTYTVVEIFVGKDEHATWFAFLDGAVIGSGHAQGEAKALAQADYEARILSALAPQAGDNAGEPVAWPTDPTDAMISAAVDKVDWEADIPQESLIVNIWHAMSSAAPNRDKIFAEVLAALNHALMNLDVPEGAAKRRAWSSLVDARDALASHPCTSTPVVSQNPQEKQP